MTTFQQIPTLGLNIRTKKGTVSFGCSTLAVKVNLVTPNTLIANRALLKSWQQGMDEDSWQLNDHKNCFLYSKSQADDLIETMAGTYAEYVHFAFRK